MSEGLGGSNYNNGRGYQRHHHGHHHHHQQQQSTSASVRHDADPVSKHTKQEEKMLRNPAAMYSFVDVVVVILRGH